MQKIHTKKILAGAAIALLLWLGLKYCLPILRPFLLGAVLALLAEPLVRVLSTRVHIPRGGAAFIGVSMTLIVLFALLTAVLAVVMRQLGALAGAAPDLEDTARAGMESLQTFLGGLAEKAPKSIRPLVSRSVSSLFSGGNTLLDAAAAKIPELATGMLYRLPDSALGFGTWLLSGFMISVRLPKIKAWCLAKLGPKWQEIYAPALKGIKRTVARWFFAQLKLMSVTALTLALGFLLLRIPYGLLWAVLISLIDALPILGTGTVLVPWSLVCFLQGDTVRGIGLLGIYAAAWLLRSVLEPRLVGKQLGLDPLLTLFSMYAGYRLLGIWGLILAPLLAVILVQTAAFAGKTEK